MSEKYPLQETLSPIDKKGRDRLNENWTRIMAYFDHVQLQIKALAGGHEVDELIARLEQAIENAEADLQDYVAQVDTTVQEAINANNTATQDAINANNTALQTALQTISSKLTELNTAISNAETATSDAIEAKNATLQATQDAKNAINTMQSLIDNFGSKGTWTSTTQFYKNNLAEVEGRTYIALKDNINTPVTDKSTWALFADKGAKGDKGEKGDTGAALSILGKLTDPSQLPPTGEAGDAYTVNGELYVWSENLDAWENVGNIKGEKGDKGDTGEDGLSAYEVAVENGYIGTSEEWLASLKGERGEIGKMTKYEYTIPATSEGQTTLEIPLSTLSIDDDLLLVLNGTVLYPDTDYTIAGSIVTLKQPVLDYSNSTFFVRVLKNIPKDSEVPTTDGSLLTDGSVAKQKLELSLQHEINTTTEHLAQNVASERGAHDLRYYNEELAYKDGEDWVEISTGNKVKEFTGNLNDLTETGMYYHTGDYTNSPVPAPAIVDVVQSPDGLTVMQIWREKKTNASFALNVRRQATRDDLSAPFVWGNVDGRNDPGFLKGWQRMYPMLSDSIDSALTNEVATANAVKQVNDKIPAVEYGTWTPAIANPDNGTYSVREGMYVKNGKMVTAYFNIKVNTPPSGAANFFGIYGLPFTAASGINFFEGYPVSIATVHGVKLDTPSRTLMGSLVSMLNNFNFYQYDSVSGVQNSISVSGKISTGAELRGSITYRIS